MISGIVYTLLKNLTHSYFLLCLFGSSWATTFLNYITTLNDSDQSGNESSFHFPLRCTSLVLRFPAYESLGLLQNWMKESQITQTAARPFSVHP